MPFNSIILKNLSIPDSYKTEKIDDIIDNEIIDAVVICTPPKTHKELALRILKNYNWHLSFLNSTVIQKRNVHDLLDDFNLEYPVYKNTKIFNDILYNIKLINKKDYMLINFFKCYKQLVNQKILEKKELELVYKWINDISKLYPNYKKI